MSTPRTLLAEQFTADHGHKVYPYPYSPSEVRAPVIAVWRTDVDPHPSSPGLLRHTLTVNAYVGKALGEEAEDALDDLLDDVLLSLQRVEGVTVTKSERTVFKDVFQGWDITCYADSANVYKQTILAEG